MEINDLKHEIDEVSAYLRVLLQESGHRTKSAKHIVALAIKQLKGIITDVKLIEFLSTNPIGKLIGYEHRPDPTTFSKIRERFDPQIIQHLITELLLSRYKDIVVDKLVEDSTDVDAYSRSDKDAKWGKRTVPKKRQSVKKEYIEDFFGYKLHVVADADKEMPLSIAVISGNRNDKIMFPLLFGATKRNFRIRLGAKFLADAQYHSTKIREEVRDSGMNALIPFSATKNRKGEDPKDPDYGRRWSIERIFSRLKEMSNMTKNKLIGLRRVKMLVYSCVLASLTEYLL